MRKSFDGGELFIAGANSSTSLRSAPVRLLILDEIDAYPGDVDGEGDPATLAMARTITYPEGSRGNGHRDLSSPAFVPGPH